VETGDSRGDRRQSWRQETVVETGDSRGDRRQSVIKQYLYSLVILWCVHFKTELN
jgi:hypothetical protein